MTEIIRIENLSKKFGDVTVLENVNLDIERGKIYGIMGRNGSGKSTIMSIASGMQPPTSGSMTYLEKP